MTQYQEWKKIWVRLHISIRNTGETKRCSTKHSIKNGMSFLFVHLYLMKQISAEINPHLWRMLVGRTVALGIMGILTLMWCSALCRNQEIDSKWPWNCITHRGSTRLQLRLDINVAACGLQLPCMGHELKHCDKMAVVYVFWILTLKACLY